ASGPALGNLGVVFRRVVRGPPARRWAILEWCFAGLYAPRRTDANLRSRLGRDKPRAYVIDALRFVGEGFMPSRSI
ncbi:MAG: hypothetical protein WB541_15980, partial [Syntrophobacteraceae bacterium]